MEYCSRDPEPHLPDPTGRMTRCEGAAAATEKTSARHVTAAASRGITRGACTRAPKRLPGRPPSPERCHSHVRDAALPRSWALTAPAGSSRGCERDALPPAWCPVRASGRAKARPRDSSWTRRSSSGVRSMRALKRPAARTQSSSRCGSVSATQFPGRSSYASIISALSFLPAACPSGSSGISKTNPFATARHSSPCCETRPTLSSSDR